MAVGGRTSGSSSFLHRGGLSLVLKELRQGLRGAEQWVEGGASDGYPPVCHLLNGVQAGAEPALFINC